MSEDRNKKLLTDALLLLVFIIVFVALQKYMGKQAAKGYWEAEDEANKKRLFGDAWKEV